MSTRSLIMVVDRRHASDVEQGFSRDPEEVASHSYVNMYMHHDGYPEWQGVQIANWLLAGSNGCKPDEIDHQYTYVIWAGNKDKIHVSCWDRYSDKCVFVLKPEKIISKYMTDMKYTDFANGETILCESKNDDTLYHAQKIIDILTHED